MPRFGMVGEDYQPDSIASDLQRTVNFYPERVESGQGKNNYVLRGTPGAGHYRAIAQVAIVAGGAGYTALDDLTVVGGTGSALHLRVETVAAGVITAISVTTSGDYSVYPTNPVSVTGGTGTGATFNLTFANAIKSLFKDSATNRVFSFAQMPNLSCRMFESTTIGITDRGVLTAATGIGKLSVSSNGLQLFIIDGAFAYLFTLATNVITDITAIVAAGSPRQGDFLDGYFIALGADGRIYLSALNDGSTWDAADVATPESSPDTAIMIKAHQGKLWIFSRETTERWYNSGDADYPFKPIVGATLKIGLHYIRSVAEVAGELIWVGRGQTEKETIWRSSGSQAIRISNHAVESYLQDENNYNNLVTASAWTYQEHGHSFYLLGGVSLAPAAGTITWCYDVTAGMWHRRMYLNGTNEISHRGRDAVAMELGHPYRILVADGMSGRVLQLLSSFTTDLGGAIRRYRRCPHLSNEEKKIIYDSVQIDLEPNLAANQRINFRWSNNGGKTWGAYRQVNVGPATSTVGVLDVEIVAGGTGYTLNDTLTVVGGVGTAATLRATTVAAGVITAVTILTAGAYTENPTNSVSVTGGTGTGATFRLYIPTFKPTRANFRRLGMARDRVFELMVEDPVEWTIVDAYLKARPGE